MRWWSRVFRKPASAELDTELEFHMDALVHEKIAKGLSPEQARREAIIDFGGTESIKDDVRDVHRLPVFDAAWTHLRYAFRVLRASPSFSLTVIATLTLGIGANTAVFSAINAVLLRPLPFPNPDRLVILKEYKPKQKSPESAVAPVRIEEWNRLNRSLQAISGFYTEDTTDSAAAGDSTGPPPAKIKRAFVAPRFLRALGISPAIGHDFTREDEHSHGNGLGTVLISDHFWREHFHSDPNVIGKPLWPARNSSTIIGVMPPGFTFPEKGVELWYAVPADAPYANRASTWFTGIGRLKPGVTLAQARADLDVVQHQLGRQFPESDADMTVELKELKETTVESSRASLWLLFGAVSILLLIACTNVSALVLARGMERQREFSLRFSLGASRLTIVAQMLTETLLLSICGTLAGLAVAAASSRAFTTLAKSIPRIAEVGFDWRLFVYTAVCAVVVTLLSGILPALQASSASPSGALSRGGRTLVTGRRPAQWVLVSVQVALAVCLLSCAGLLLRSFQALSQVSPGFDASHVLVFRMTGSYGETADIPNLKQSINRVLETLRTLPGVEAAAASLSLPGVPYTYPAEFTSPDLTLEPGRKMTAESRYVSDGYFSTMRIPMIAGAPCDPHLDSAGVVVNRSFASTYFDSANPIGHHLLATPNIFNMRTTILGVAADAREAGLNEEPVPTVYFCGSVIDPSRAYLVRTAGEPASLANAVRQRMHSLEPGRAVYDLEPLPEHLSDAFAEVRLRTLLLTLFAATALALACVGLYGTMAYFVTARRREIGVRMALGATRNSVGLRFVGQGLGVACGGAAAGLCFAAWSARFIAGMLYNVHPNDATALSTAIATMLLVALMASAIPAVRATRVDPMQILREE